MVKLTKLLLWLILLGLSATREAMAEIPPIESAPLQVDSYIRCVQDAFTKGPWQSTTLTQCRAASPAVRSLKEGDYVALTFSRAQTTAYNQARNRWIEFDKSLKAQILSTGRQEYFNRLGVQTAFSFTQAEQDLNNRFQELEVPPLSWYPATRTELRAVNGMSLQQLHQSELGAFTRCVESAMQGADIRSATLTQFKSQAETCKHEITQRNLGGLAGIYNQKKFDQISNQRWAAIASAQSQAETAERERLAREEANSWPVKLRAIAGQFIIWASIALGIFLVFRFRASLATVVPSGQSTGSYRHRNGPDNDEDDYGDYEEPSPRASRSHSSQRSSYREDSHGRDRQTSKPEKVDLGTFGLKHHKIGSFVTRHRCASCIHWAGQRTPHPVNQDTYVKIGTKGKCNHKHPGSPYGIKRHDDGSICKDYKDIGY